VIDLTPAQAADRIAALLAAPESRTLDFKRISAKHTRMVETICAYANSDGGLLVIGVGDAKDLKPGAKPENRLFGIEESPEGFDDFRRLVMQRFAPPLARLHWLRVPCTLHNGQPGHVVMLRVEKSDQVHSVVGNGTWTRMEASNRELSASEIAELAYQRGVRSAASELVMFAEMAAAKLYPPRYRQNTDAAVESVTVTLLNLAPPSMWDEVSDWIDRRGPIANSKLREISGLDTLAASKQLRNWVAQGVLVALPAASRQQASYTKPELLAARLDSLSLGLDNETGKTTKLF